MAFPSYYSENKDEYVSSAFPMSKTAKKQIDMLLNRFLKSGKKSCSLRINEHGDEDDDDYEINEYDDDDKIYGDDDDDDDKIYGDDDKDDFDDLPF